MKLHDRFTDNATAQDQAARPGVYCDVYGTLVNSSFEPNQKLVLYLNALHEAGIPVTIFSTDHFGMRRKTQNIGLHYELAGLVQNKARYANVLLETVIDDDPPHYIKAETLWNPKDTPLYAHIDAELERLKATPTQSPAP